MLRYFTRYLRSLSRDDSSVHRNDRFILGKLHLQPLNLSNILVVYRIKSKISQYLFTGSILEATFHTKRHCMRWLNHLDGVRNRQTLIATMPPVGESEVPSLPWLP